MAEDVAKRPRCPGITLKGTPCKNHATMESGRCWYHDKFGKKLTVRVKSKREYR